MEYFLSLLELVMTIHFHFLEKVKPKCKDMKNTLGIRHHNIQTMLKWVINNNPSTRM